MVGAEASQKYMYFKKTLGEPKKTGLPANVVPQAACL